MKGRERVGNIRAKDREGMVISWRICLIGDGGIGVRSREEKGGGKKRKKKKKKSKEKMNFFKYINGGK